MCGICGLYHFYGQRSAGRQTLESMAYLIRHRGPDDENHLLDGPFGMYHKRLSIIDLSEAGRQPMTNEDGRYWIILNGVQKVSRNTLF